jgi:hypothetical protein
MPKSSTASVIAEVPNTHGMLSPNNLWPCNFALPSVEDRVMNHAVVFCVALDPICCTLQTFNKMKVENPSAKECVVCNLAVITPVSAGFSKAPFEGKNLPSSQYLSNINVDADHGRELLLTGFDKHSSSNNEYRGDHRPDVCALVRTGCTLKIIVGKHTFNPKFQPIFEPGTSVIASGDIVRLVLHCGNANGVTEEEIKGCFIKISKVSRLQHSLSSFLPHMRVFPGDFASQKRLTESCAGFSRFPAEEGKAKVPVAGMIFGNGGECALVTDINHALVCVEVDVEKMAQDGGYEDVLPAGFGIVKLQNVTSTAFPGDRIDEMDVERRLLKQCCNCSDVGKCCKLLEMAASLGALSVFAMKKYTFNHNPLDKKRLEGMAAYRGVPIVNFQKLLGIFWHNGEMRGLKDFMEALHKRDFEEMAVRFSCDGSSVLIHYTGEVITVRHLGRLYTVEGESREVIVSIHPLIRTEDAKDAVESGASLDNQLVHKSVKLQKYCKVTVDLGPVVTDEAKEAKEAKDPKDGYHATEVDPEECGDLEATEGYIKSYIGFKMNLSLSPVEWSFGGKKDDVLVNHKRKRISMEDADGDSS